MPVSSHKYSKYGKKLAPFVWIKLALGDVPSPNKVLTVISVAFASHPVLPVLSLREAKALRNCAVFALFICLLMKIVVKFVHISFYMIYINCSESSIICKSCLVTHSAEKLPSCPQMDVDV